MSGDIRTLLNEFASACVSGDIVGRRKAGDAILEAFAALSTPDDVTRELAEALMEVSAAIQVDGNTGQFVLARSFDAITVDAALASYESKYGSKA